MVRVDLKAPERPGGGVPSIARRRAQLARRKGRSRAASTPPSRRLRCGRNCGGACPQHFYHPRFSRGGAHAKAKLAAGLLEAARGLPSASAAISFDRDVRRWSKVREALNASSVGCGRGEEGGGRSSSGRVALGPLDWALLDGHLGVAAWGGDARCEQAKAQAEAEAKRKSEETEKQRLATLKVEQERRQSRRRAKKRKSEEAEQQRVAALKAEQEERNRLTPSTLCAISQGNADSKAGEYDRAIAAYNEAIRLDPKSAFAYVSRGDAYADKGDNDRAIADFNEAIRLDPKSALAFRSRGVAYADKGDNDRAIADFNKAIRLDPKSALAFMSLGDAYANKDEYDRAIADYNGRSVSSQKRFL